MFLAVLIKDGIGVVNVHENFATFGIAGELRQQAVASRERKMAHFASSLLAAPDFSQFIAGPESTVQESDINGLSCFQAFSGTFCQGRRVARKLFWVFDTHRHHGFLFGGTESQTAAVRKRPAIGVPVVSVGGGAGCGVVTICVRRSGDAASRKQTEPSGENAN